MPRPRFLFSLGLAFAIFLLNILVRVSDHAAWPLLQDASLRPADKPPRADAVPAAAPLVHAGAPYGGIRAALVSIFDERSRDSLKYLPMWYKALPWMRNPGRTWVMLYCTNGIAWKDWRTGLSGDGLVTKELLDTLRSMVPGWDVRFVPFKYDARWQAEAWGGASGGAQINWMLGHSFFFGLPTNFGGPNDFLKDFDYMMRLDDDVGFVGEAMTLDVFEDMHARGVRVGWVQQGLDNSIGLQSGLFQKVQHYVRLGRPNFNVSDVWEIQSHRTDREHNKYNDWRGILVGGCVEMYKMDVFRNQHYRRFMDELKVAILLRKKKIWEQEVKTMWMQLFVPLSQWHGYACDMQPYHKHDTLAARRHWFFVDCNWKNHTRTMRGKCDADPDPDRMRIC